VGFEGRILNEADGYAVTLPAGWRRIDLTEGDVEAILEAAGVDDPQMAELLEGTLGSAVATGLKFMAFRTADLASDVPTNVNILSAPSMGLSLEFLEELNVSQIEQLDTVVGEVTSERITLPSGEALHLSYALSGGDTADEIVLEQYLFLAGNSQHILTVTGEDDPDVAAEAAAMAESFEILSAP
jgi:hypothetical protein